MLKSKFAAAARAKIQNRSMRVKSKLAKMASSDSSSHGKPPAASDRHFLTAQRPFILFIEGFWCSLSLVMGPFHMVRAQIID